ncbi:HAD-IA family hydrolase [Capilliphycus salinus ALCB114379]|uniref:HAD-IA family hydrolase n=1 Tax=Capilliphycus salinus TaxID=2768948 RepID=UPI0039A68A93
MLKPQVIFLDAVGTLFGVRDSVGEVYAKLAYQFGVVAEPHTLNKAFFQQFVNAPAMAFPGKQLEEIPLLEFQWWEIIAQNTFKQVELFEKFEDFSLFFKDLYAYFETDKPWFVYPDVQPTLKRWKNQGIELGVLSNFDSRLYPVLEALNLAEYFTSVTISTQVGAAKPDPKIFTVAIEKYQCSPEKVIHIGDSFKADYQGAKAAGIQAILINRNEGGKTIPFEQESEFIECQSLEELPF